MITIVHRSFMDVVKSVGELALMTSRTLVYIFKGNVDRRNVVEQMLEVGVRSFPVIALTSVFTGMVMALQTGAAFRNIFNEPVYVGSVVGFAIVKELGPVLTSIVISGRVGAAIAAELGSMKVTEQLDALYTLGTNPVKYLAVPRFIANLVMLPILALCANIIGIVGGMLVTVYKWGVPSTVYWDDILDHMDIGDLMHGLIKSLAFALIIVSVSCYKGFACEGGAEGVGKTTTGAVMISMVMILVSDYFISSFLVAIGIG
ncbi:MAG: ABC transporter permease [Elusimicrobia bacterium HGW-Elusimicrobia-1]|jgi:phospholipid/cholesterol/gamma-HCH transport system permease protein|nr:MAG: ABC transporter permease [Elusimicrobia bacterium HGW-Elusimicrobia-1]